jgi:ribose/xylose/arabinose/galactoside ABC-type transport system permease subunit
MVVGLLAGLGGVVLMWATASGLSQQRSDGLTGLALVAVAVAVLGWGIAHSPFTVVLNMK